jgi:hypothetical protein
MLELHGSTVASLDVEDELKEHASCMKSNVQETMMNLLILQKMLNHQQLNCIIYKYEINSRSKSYKKNI